MEARDGTGDRHRDRDHRTGGRAALSRALVDATRVSGKPPALRMVLCGSTTIPGQLVAEVREVWDVPLRSFWGMTEVPGHAWTRSDDPPLWALHSDGRPGSGIELDFRSDTGAAPTLEQPARLFVRGGGVCLATIGRDSGLLQVTSHLDGAGTTPVIWLSRTGGAVCASPAGSRIASVAPS